MTRLLNGTDASRDNYWCLRAHSCHGSQASAAEGLLGRTCIKRCEVLAKKKCGHANSNRMLNKIGSCLNLDHAVDLKEGSRRRWSLKNGGAQRQSSLKG